LIRVDYLELTLEINGVIEGVIRSFRKAVTASETGPYQPWIQRNTKWAG
jgi:hypothetical protein